MTAEARKRSDRWERELDASDPFAGKYFPRIGRRKDDI